MTIGTGEGQNWWCVLFPPLCSVDCLSGEAVASAAVVARTEGDGKVKSSSTPATKDSKAAPTVKPDKSNPDTKEVKVAQVEEKTESVLMLSSHKLSFLSGKW